MAKRYGLPKAMRLRRRAEINEVFRRGRYHALGVLHAKTLPTEHAHLRFMISVRRKIGPAPRRNRIKRLVREAVRLHRHELHRPHDICLFLTKPPRQPLDLAAVEKEIRKLFRRLNQHSAASCR